MIKPGRKLGKRLNHFFQLLFFRRFCLCFCLYSFLGSVYVSVYVLKNSSVLSIFLSQYWILLEELFSSVHLSVSMSKYQNITISISQSQKFKTFTCFSRLRQAKPEKTNSSTKGHIPTKHICLQFAECSFRIWIFRFLTWPNWKSHWSQKTTSLTKFHFPIGHIWPQILFIIAGPTM